MACLLMILWVDNELLLIRKVLKDDRRFIHLWPQAILQLDCVEILFSINVYVEWMI